MGEEFLHLEDYDPAILRRHYRQEIKQFFNGLCAYCGNPGNTLDHVIPRSKGGQDTYRNLIVACYRCNQNKSNHDMEDWFKRQSFFCELRLQRIKDLIK